MWPLQFFCSIRSKKTFKMRQLTLVVLVAVFAAVVAAEGQFYVPRAYYTIDAEGHASAPVPLRRLRRSVMPYYPRGAGASANANANADANSWDGGDATATANANANAHAGAGAGSAGGYGSGPAAFASPYNLYGAAKPAKPGFAYRMAGPVSGANGVSASSSVGMDSSGQGYYDNEASVSG